MRPSSGVRSLLAFVLVLAACGGGLVATSPTPAIALGIAELKYRFMDGGGRSEFCARDFYPIARANEDDLAKAKIADIQKDAETYAAITKRVGTDALAVYRDWKALNALALSPFSFGSPSQAQVASFDYRSTGGAGATAPKASGTQVEGEVDLFCTMEVVQRAVVGSLSCPI